MKKEAKKLSLADFKAKAKAPNSQELLNKISGGLQDDCHIKEIDLPEVVVVAWRTC